MSARLAPLRPSVESSPVTVLLDAASTARAAREVIDSQTVEILRLRRQRTMLLWLVAGLALLAVAS